MLVQTTPPTSEPITLAEARLHLKLTSDDPTDEDSLIEGIWIPAARRHAEMLTHRSFITQTWRLVLDCFPHCINLERGQVQQIDSLVYRDMAGTTQTMTWSAVVNGIQRSSDGTLVADLTSEVARIAPAFGRCWPIPLPEIGAVAVNYTAGYGNAAAVPEGIKSWMFLRIASLDQNREDLVNQSLKPLPYLDGMLDPYTIAMP